MNVEIVVALIGIAASVITGTLSQIAGYLLILRWIIRRQVEGNWVLRVDHEKALADKDRLIDAEREVAKEWREAYQEEQKAGRIKDDTINKSVQANKISDHFYATVMPKVPLVGDNEGRGEGTS